METEQLETNGGNGALVVADKVTALALSAEHVEVIKRTICPAGIPDVEFRLFIEQCRRSGLDPLQKQMFCVKRRQKVGDKYVEKFEAQPAEAGMLARAEKFADFRGIQAAAIYAKDNISLSPSTGRVQHDFTPFADRGKLLGAWSKVDRDGRVPTVLVVSFDERVQEHYNWKKMPETMIVKCARVAALRVAYPEAFGGLYISEEMPTADPQQPRTISHDGEAVDTSTGEVVEDRISEAQRKRLWAMAQDAWPGKENAMHYLRELLGKYGFKSSTDVLRVKYDAICAEIEAAAMPAEEAEIEP